MTNTIKSLNDLDRLRSAPVLTGEEHKNLMNQLVYQMNSADWFTLGIMTCSEEKSILIIREIEKFFNWQSMKIASKPNTKGPVFLKANQKTGDIHIRKELGLGEGILITCQKNNQDAKSSTFGPLPLNFFSH